MREREITKGNDASGPSDWLMISNSSSLRCQWNALPSAMHRVNGESVTTESACMITEYNRVHDFYIQVHALIHTCTPPPQLCKIKHMKIIKTLNQNIVTEWEILGNTVPLSTFLFFSQLSTIVNCLDIWKKCILHVNIKLLKFSKFHILAKEKWILFNRYWSFL